jgi:neurofibromin 1
MERSLNKPVELLFDVTQFGPSNEIPNQWLNQLLQLLPPDVHENIATVYIYNANSHLRKYTKKLPRPLTHKFGKRIVFAVTLAELHEHIAPSEVRLPKSTSKCKTDTARQNAVPNQNHQPILPYPQSPLKRIPVLSSSLSANYLITELS